MKIEYGITNFSNTQGIKIKKFSDVEKSYYDIEDAAAKILSGGYQSVLMEGCELANENFSHDYWTNGTESFWLTVPRYSQKNHNIESHFSSVIHACLSLGYAIKDAIVIAKMLVNRELRTSEINNFNWPEDEIDLPYVTQHPMQHKPQAFNPCGELGIYPIVDSAAWVKKLLPIGVKTLQLRIKDKTGLALENEIKQSIELAKKYDAKLFINDYWELALRYQAYGVHLGQTDLTMASIAEIQRVGLRLGVSTHGYYEVARAHALRPSYIACGPIFATTSKLMAVAPQGIAQLKRWRRTLNYPLVAIGGINKERLAEILAAKVEGIAMISAITQASDPLASARELLAGLDKRYT